MRIIGASAVVLQSTEDGNNHTLAITLVKMKMRKQYGVGEGPDAAVSPRRRRN